MVEMAGSFLIPKERKALEARCSFIYIDELLFSPEVDRAWIGKKIQKHIEKNAPIESWHQALFQKAIEKQNVPQLSVRPSPLQGYGLFAEETLFPLSFVGEYVGLVKERDTAKDRDNDYVFAYAIGAIDLGYVIDAEKLGNHTRFVNHSSFPNLLSRSIVVGKSARVFYFANRKIEKGEELLLNYGPDYWEEEV